MLRAVIDTNILISGAFWNRPPRRVLLAVREKKAEMLASAAIVTEITGDCPAFMKRRAKSCAVF